MKNPQLAALAASLFLTAICGNLPLPSIGLPGQPSGGVDDTLANPAVCTTAKCKEIATHINKFLAPNYATIDPCVDFHKYVCNGQRSIDYHNTEGYLSSDTHIIKNNVKKLMRTALEGLYVENMTTFGDKNAFDKKNLDKAKKVYAACMNEKAIKAYGVTPLHKVLHELEKVYPVDSTKGTNSPNDELTNALIYLFKMDDGSLLYPELSVSSAQFLLTVPYFQ